MNNEEMKKIMLEGPAIDLKDEHKNEIINKIADVMSDMVTKIKSSEEGSRTFQSADDSETETETPKVAATTAPVLIKREYDDKDNIKQPLMDNVFKYLMAQSHTNSEALNNIIIDLSERFIDKTPAKHFVGVQPIRASVGLVYTLQYRYQNDNEINEEGAEDSPIDSIKSEQSHKMTLEVISQVVEARTKKFDGTQICIEAIQDLGVVENSEKVKNDMLNSISYDLAKNVYTELVGDLQKIAFKQNVELCVNDPIISSQLAVISINKASNEIARKTRRGTGNYIIVSKEMYKIITFAQKSIFEKATEEEDVELDYGFVKYMGKLHGTIKVFVDKDMQADKVLMGYKGGNGQVDAGYFINRSL